MPSPVLLVADDLSTIAAVKRVLAREGFEVVLATNAADALIAWGHHLPGLVLLQPSVEGDRGGVVLEELQQYPEARLLRVVLLGETLPGFPYVVEPLPLDAAHFVTTLTESMRATSGSGAWEMIEAPKASAPPAPGPAERDDWRATGPKATFDDEIEAAPDVEVPEFKVDGQAPETEPETAALEDKLFGDLELMHRDIEAEAIASVESTLAQRAQPDDELQRLEDDVRAEAQRRRKTRETPVAISAATTLTGDDETSFADEMPAESPLLTKPDAPGPVEAREVLARAEAMLLAGRAAADASRRAEETAARQEKAQSEDLSRRAEHAEAQAQQAEAQLRQLREAHEQHLRLERDLHEQLAAARHLVDSLQAASETREGELHEAQAQLEVAHELQSQLQLEVETGQQRLEVEVRANQQLNDQVTEFSNELARVSARNAELEQQVVQLRLLQHEVEQLAVERDALNLRVLDLTPLVEETKAQQVTIEQTDRALQSAKSRADELAEHVVALESNLSSHRSQAHESSNEREVLRGDVDRLSTELAAATDIVTRLTKDLNTVREALDAAAARADTAEAGVQLAGERLKALEQRATMPLTLPGRRVLGVPRTGSVDLEGLATLVAQIVLAQADARLELGVAGGLRVLWFKKGQVAAAESTLAHETLIDRARRDGLIDVRQETELRLMKHASAREQLDALRSRNLLRDVEAVPLAQRYTEHLTLEALTENATHYRLADDVPTSEVLQASVPRATLPMLAEAIRRALPVDALLEKLGGGQAVCQPRDVELDLRALGFSDRERKMLSWVDGETTVEDLTLASGLKQDVAFRALLVAKLLGLVAVLPASHHPVAPSSDLEIQRLDAKYDEVLDADYFTVLGLTKTAGTDEVQRAFARLSTEFDPLKYSGHPDPALQQRAQVVHAHLEEAAKALEDERRRSEYARHLLD